MKYVKKISQPGTENEFLFIGFISILSVVTIYIIRINET